MKKGRYAELKLEWERLLNKLGEPGRTEDRALARVPRITANQLVQELWRLTYETHDERFTAALDALLDLGLIKTVYVETDNDDISNVFNGMRSTWIKNRPGPKDIFRRERRLKDMSRLIDAGCSVREAAAEVATLHQTAAESFDGAVKSLTRLWTNHRSETQT